MYGSAVRAYGEPFSESSSFAALAITRTADRRGHGILQDPQILERTACPRLRHRRPLRYRRRFRDARAADRMGGGCWNRAFAVHGAGPAVAAAARTVPGGDSGRGSASI